MTVEQALAEAARQLKENPQEYIDRLMKCTPKELERKLDITREQKKMAFDEKKHESFVLLHIKEELIMDVIMIKADNETYDKPKKKTIKKRNKKVEEIFNKPKDNKELESQDNEIHNNNKNKSEQLLLDF